MKLLSILLIFTSLILASPLPDADRQLYQFLNMKDNTNGGCENGTSKWTNSGGTFTTTSTAANVADGKRACSFDASNTSQYFETSQFTLPAYMREKHCLARVWLKGFDANYAINIIDEDNDVLATYTLTAYTSYQMVDINFVPDSDGTTVRFQIISSADGAIGYLDDLYIGLATNLTQVSQAYNFAGAKFTGKASCEWTSTAGSFTDFATDADCSTVALSGSATGTGTGYQPAVTTGAGKSGDYYVFATGAFQVVSSSDTCYFTISDGTTKSGKATLTSISYESVPTLIGKFSYTSSFAAKTFIIQAYRSGSTNNCRIDNQQTVQNFEINVLYVPSGSELAVTNETMTQIGRASHDVICGSWLNTNATYDLPTGDATCNFSFDTTRSTNWPTITSVADGTGNQPGIKFTPTRLGTIFICAQANYLMNQTANKTAFAKLFSDGVAITNQHSQYWQASGAAASSSLVICTTDKITSFAQKQYDIRLAVDTGGQTNLYGPIDWDMFYISNQLPMPNILNMVTTSSNGGLRINSATLNCDSGSSITSQDGTWISAIGNISSGACAVTVTSGIFTTTPRCFANAIGTTKDVRCQLNPTSTTAFTLYATKPSDGSDLTTVDCDVYCIGGK